MLAELDTMEREALSEIATVADAAAESNDAASADAEGDTQFQPGQR